MDDMKTLLAFYDRNEPELTALADEIFAYRELSLEETKSSAALAGFLEKNGFTVQWDLPGLPTAFLASWGDEGPGIGFLAEYDALPGFGQEPKPFRAPQDGPGHACGHNLLGVGAAAAGLALKELVTAKGAKARVYVYGCPAEEVMRGKKDMVEAGWFDRLDAAVAWHPSTYNTVSEESNQAMSSLEFEFKGRAAHAAISPHMGRSALDACELMNVAVNYLREHMTDDVRIHYVYVNGGEKANIVPDYAKLSYGIRAQKKENVRDAIARVVKCAQGAALMTETEMEYHEISSCAHTKVNFALNEPFYEAMTALPPLRFTDDERKFAIELSTNSEGKFNQDILRTHLTKPEYKVIPSPGSTDVADVSHVVPTVSIFTTCAYNRAPAHHWTFAACCGMSIGIKGMLYASQIMALGACKLVETPAYLEKAKAEFSEETP